jgi:hypothetical protein
MYQGMPQRSTPLVFANPFNNQVCLPLPGFVIEELGGNNGRIHLK